MFHKEVFQQSDVMFHQLRDDPIKSEMNESEWIFERKQDSFLKKLRRRTSLVPETLTNYWCSLLSSLPMKMKQISDVFYQPHFPQQGPEQGHNDMNMQCQNNSNDGQMDIYRDLILRHLIQDISTTCAKLGLPTGKLGGAIY